MSIQNKRLDVERANFGDTIPYLSDGAMEIVFDGKLFPTDRVTLVEIGSHLLVEFLQRQRAIAMVRTSSRITIGKDICQAGTT
jgi:hypothetical protein